MLNKALDIASSLPYIKGQQRIAAVTVDKMALNILNTHRRKYECITNS